MRIPLREPACLRPAELPLAREETCRELFLAQDSHVLLRYLILRESTLRQSQCCKTAQVLFGVWGLGFGVWGFGLGVWGLGIGGGAEENLG